MAFKTFTFAEFTKTRPAPDIWNVAEIHNDLPDAIYARIRAADPLLAVLDRTHVYPGPLVVGDDVSLHIVYETIKKATHYKLSCIDNLKNIRGAISREYDGHAARVIVALNNLRADLAQALAAAQHTDRAGDVLTYRADGIVDIAMVAKATVLAHHAAETAAA